MHYKQIPALAAYIDRIGAEQLNFRRFIVRDYKGHYYTERCIIRVDKEGVVTSSNAEYSPSKEEAEAIKEAISKVDWPRGIGARSTEGLAKLTQGGALFEFWNVARTEIIMVQERVQKEDGRKFYVPWTFFSDGEWRSMEPDTALPFWKPAQTRHKKRFMIHEGAKAAAACDAIVTDTSVVHPWKEELSSYEHWGMIGGALAPHRTDYEELHKEKPEEVIYVCDNDYSGTSALQEVSRCYRQAMKGIKFDSRWPASWDLADDMPESFFNKIGSYTGPGLFDLLQAATWGTEVLFNEKGKKSGVTLRRPFREEWFHSVSPEVFIHRDFPQNILSEKEFNNTISPYSDVTDTAVLLKKDDSAKSAVLKYDPSKPPGVYGSDVSGRFINSHKPSSIRSKKGNAGPWLKFIEHLVPIEEDRKELLRWVATLIARPEIKILYGVLLISETQGVGKSTLGEKILAPLIGLHNCSFPSESEVVEGQFNAWQAHKRLAIVNEIYAGQSAKAYNKLKNIITDKHLTINKKFMAQYHLDNWIHIFACSNSKRALRLDNDDRRWFIPKVTEEKLDKAYWESFNAWLNDEDGLRIIRWWCFEWLKKNAAVTRGEGAPWSTLKREVIEEGYSQGMCLVLFLLNKIKNGDLTDQERTALKTLGAGAPEDGIVMYDVDLVEVIKEIIHQGRPSDRLERPATIRKIAKANGWVIGSKHLCHRGSVHARLICSNIHLAEMDPKDALRERKALDVVTLARDWTKIH